MFRHTKARHQHIPAHCVNRLHMPLVQATALRNTPQVGVCANYRISGIECVSKEYEIASFYLLRKVFTRIDITYLLYCIV